MTTMQDAPRYNVSINIRTMDSPVLSQDLQAYVDTLPPVRHKGIPAGTWTKINPSAIVFRCCKCEQYLPVTSFYPVKDKRGARKDVLGTRRNGRCRDCCMQDYFERDHRFNLYYSAKARARDKGLPFTIVPEDIVVPECCPVLGIKLQASIGTGRLPIDKLWYSPTVDRLDNAEGYTPENIRVISHRANSLKNNATLEELKQIVNYIERELEVKRNNELLAETAHTTTAEEVIK